MSARDEVYTTIRERLTQGVYQPSDVLIPGTLSTEFAVSRTPVREALGLLERDGLLRSTSRGFTPWIRSAEEVLEIFEVRGILESAAAAAAAQRRTDTDIVRLRESARLAREADTAADIRRHLNTWHDAVRRAAHNTTISNLLHTLEAHIKVAAPWRDTATTSTRPIDDRRDEHEAILTAIIDRDDHAARSLMLAHLDNDQRARVRDHMRVE